MWWLVAAAGWASTFDDHDPRRFYMARSSPERSVRAASRAVVWFEEGTGFVVSARGHVLTTGHVAELEGSDTEVRLPNGRWVDLTLVDREPALDVALYRRTEPVPTSSWIQLRATPASAGEPVAVIGNPSRMSIRVSFGEVVATTLRVSHPAPPPVIGYSAVAWWGSSGSPVIDTEGRAVAMHWGWERSPDKPFAGVPVERLLGGFPALADATSGCPDPEGRLTTRLQATDRGLRAVVAGPRACVTRIRAVTWVNRDGQAVATSEAWGGRAWVAGPRPLSAQLRMDAGHQLELRPR